jgi:superfamily II DNA or RNA helicase
MTTTFEFKPGSLVTLRNRPWVVLPSEDTDLLLLKPLGGSEEEITGIYLPVAGTNDIPQSYDFIKPSNKDLGDFTSAKLLYNAARLSFRNAAGPFRCLGKLSFRPRSYQMVPLIMALKQQNTRLLIADDVGVGKTIEALLIAKELYDRKEIKRMAIVCLPHLCDQWQDELKDKFGIEAVIIRSGTASGLERQIRHHENIFRAFPFQIISIDFIKSGNKRQVFLDHCPEMIIVDESHTCAKPAGAHEAQQLRYKLIHDISKKDHQHLLLLTATPHSGKEEEFRSLLGLLNKSFEQIDIVQSTNEERIEIAKHFIQRRRADVVKWLDEETQFPERHSIEKAYKLTEQYEQLFNEILSYARELVAQTAHDKRKQRYNYWDVLALLRGVMSSPAAGVSMLTNKSNKKLEKESLIEPVNSNDEIEIERESVMDDDYTQDDNLPLSVLGKGTEVLDSESKRLMTFVNRMQGLFGIEHDAKANTAFNQVKDYIEKGYNPIIFCKYIPTANYLGEIFKEQFKGKKFKNLHIEVVTSELNDELRREKIQEMNKSERRLLIATDCLSEGINLQDGFNAMVHYDLPWNPNRLEQREGRIDRFGQQTEKVQIALLYGSNNPIDGVVLEVLLRKARDIRLSIGISVPFPEESTSVMEAVTNAILLKPNLQSRQVTEQLSMFEAEEIEEEKNRIAIAFEEAKQRELTSRNIFAQNAIKATEIDVDLREIDNAIGDVKAVEQFVVDSLRLMGVQVDTTKDGYKLYTSNIHERLKMLLPPKKNELLISFKSPTPAGYTFIGRNHRFTESLTQYVMQSALQGETHLAARSAVLRTSDVSEKTVLMQLRVRNVIEEQPGNKQIVAEEMWLWGYEGEIDEQRFLDKDKALYLLMNIRPSQNMENSEKSHWINSEMSWVDDEQQFRHHTDAVALERAHHLVKSHMRFRTLVNQGANTCNVVEPILPMDVLGMYIFLPVS